MKSIVTYFLFCSLLLPGNTYHVSSSGALANPGTVAGGGATTQNVAVSGGVLAPFVMLRGK